MKIGINALYLLPGKVGGSETYIRNLVKWLIRSDLSNTYCIFINRESDGIFDKIAPGIEVIPCPIHAINRPVRILWEQAVLPFQAWKRNLDILLSPGMTTPFFCPIPSVLVIYDLQHINQPHNFPPSLLFFLRVVLSLSAKAANGIIAISGHVKDDIVKHYGIAPGKIAVGYLGVNHENYFPGKSSKDTAIRVRYNLPEHYIFYAAALLPHKNHELLLRAFKEIREELPGWKLVLTGAWETGREKLSASISALGLHNDVMLLGWLPFEDIASIYRGAELFVYPTLHEGFGLPVLEAMACGIPVVCSRIEPLIEVSGDAALLVNPENPSDIAQGMLAALRDTGLRQELIRKGFERSMHFTWEKTAKDTLCVLETIHAHIAKKTG